MQGSAASAVSPDEAETVLLDIGKTPIFGEAREGAMADAADELMREALGQASASPKSENRVSDKDTLKKNAGQRGKRRIAG